jgi:tetratricopeptide (TPR) repeat protein
LNELQSEEKSRLRRQLAERAINLAMSGNWTEAVEVNRRLIEELEPDVEAWNRLGKAYAQLGRIADARGAYEAALKLDPSNTIAQRNLHRLASIKEEAMPAGSADGKRAEPDFFIEETGKTVATSIFSDAPKEALARVAAGDMLDMRREGDVIAVTTRSGERLGVLEGKLSARLIELQAGGNEYAVATVAVNPDRRELRVLVRELRQSPQLAGRVSFPAETTTGFRAYIKGSVIREERLDEDEDEGLDEAEALLPDDEEYSAEPLDYSEDAGE